MQNLFRILARTAAAVVVAGLCAGCIGGPATPWATLNPAADQPQVFFPGQVSDPATQQWAFAFTPDGAALFVATDAPRRILTQTWERGAWQPPMTLDEGASDRDGSPFVTPDGFYLYFSSWRDGRSSDLYRRSLRPLRDTERVTLTDQFDELGVAIARNGSALMWTSRKANGTAGTGLYQVRAVGGRVQIVADAGDLQGGAGAGAHSVFLDPDGRFLAFANYDVAPGTGEDLFVSRIRNGLIEPPVALGETVNTPFNETAPYVTPDGQYLLFSSDRPSGAQATPGDYQIWWIPVAAVPALAEAAAR